MRKSRLGSSWESSKWVIQVKQVGRCSNLVYLPARPLCFSFCVLHFSQKLAINCLPAPKQQVPVVSCLFMKLSDQHSSALLHIGPGWWHQTLLAPCKNCSRWMPSWRWMKSPFLRGHGWLRVQGNTLSTYLNMLFYHHLKHLYLTVLHHCIPLYPLLVLIQGLRQWSK
jgi:hypothetical protein